MPRDGNGDAVLVARDARDQRRAGDAVAIEFGNPAIGERLGRAGRFPAELRDYGAGAIVLPIWLRGRDAFLLREGVEESLREEVAMRVIQHA